jgi:drug/metabolite transporter (DMT)-like permease
MIRILGAYIGVILLWATTPLAIKWSAESLGVLWAATSRMIIGVLCMIVLSFFLKKPLSLSRPAFLTYGAVALQIYGAMSVVYWSSQFIPSGWLSVISGLTPLVTALFAAIWLNERSLTLGKMLSYLLGIVGLSLMYDSAEQVSVQAVWGVIGVLISVGLQAMSAVGIKRINAKLSAYSQVTGGLFVALPLYLITCSSMDTPVPLHFSLISFLAVLYLGIIATPAGFILYYYLLSQHSATQVSLITLVCPVIALWLGHHINAETITLKIISGTAVILFALLLHNFFDKLIEKYS